MGPRVVALVLALAALAAAADTPEAAADNVLAAVRAGGDLRELAARDDPDPWLVADELCARGEHGAAEVFAKAAPRKDVEALPQYVASRRGKAIDAGARGALAAANEALAAGHFARALKAVDDCPPPKDDPTAAVRLAAIRGMALRRLARLQESTDAFLAAATLARGIGAVAGAADLFREAAASAYARPDHRAALAAWEACLLIEEARDHRRGIAHTLNWIGDVHYRLGAHGKSLEYQERSLRLAEQIGDRELVAGALGNISNVHYSRGNYPAALDCLDRSLKLYEQIGNRGGIAGSFQKLGNVHLQLGAFGKALDFHRRCLELCEAQGDRASAADALGNIGLVYNSMGNHAEALDYMGRELAVAEELNDRSGIAKVLGNIGNVHYRLGDWAQALDCQERALRLSEELGNRGAVGRALNTIGTLHSALGDQPRALEYATQALAVKESVEDLPGVARSLMNIGLIYDRLGDYPAALEHLERALDGAMGLGLRVETAMTLGNLGLVHFTLGDYAAALAHLERALALATELGYRPGVAAALSNIATVRDSLGDHAGALECHERALRLEEEAGERPAVAASLVNIGNAHEGLGDHRKALAYRERALKLTEELGDRLGVVKALLGLGRLHHALGDQTKALECHERALKLAEEIRDRSDAAVALLNIGSVQHAMREHAKALDTQERARAAAERLGEQELVAWALVGLARTRLASGDPAGAADCAREATGVLARLAAGLADVEGASMRQEFAGAFEAGARACVVLGDTVGVSFFLEAGRALTLLESLGGHRRIEALVLPKELRKAETDARGAEAAALARYRRALDGAGDPELLWRELEGARGELLGVARRIQREAKAQACVVYPEIASLDRIRATVKEGEAIVTYAVLAHEAVALVVTSEAARIVPLGASEAILKAAAALQGTVVRPDERGVAVPPHEQLDYVAKRLRALVVEPLGLKGMKRLLVAPDATLAYLPIAFLAPEVEVAYVPSGTTYELLLGDAALRGEGVLALGDPPAGDAQAAGVYRGGGDLPPLPASRAEAQAIGDVVLVGKDATECGFLKAVASRPRWRAVHFACHGLVRADLPELSCLALGADAENDGFLTVLEVFRLKIPADLVVLSACETAKGKVYRAEGVIGLARAFMLAGSPRVICSLWKVDDAATRELMTAFYKEWKPGVGAAAALKKAQQHVASQEKWKDPYFWAAWQLWGLPE